MFDVRERSTKSWQNSSQQARRREARAGVHDSHFFGAIECGVGPCKPAVHEPGSDLGWRYRHFQWLWQATTFLHLQQLATRLGLDLTKLSRSVAQLSCALFFFSVSNRFFDCVSATPIEMDSLIISPNNKKARRTSVHLEFNLSHMVLRGKAENQWRNGTLPHIVTGHREDRGSSETRTGLGVADLEPSRDVALRYVSGPLPTTRRPAQHHRQTYISRRTGTATCSLHVTSVKFIRIQCLTISYIPA